MRKIVLITGSTAGIGKETAVGIARQPGYLVVLHGRNAAKAQAAVQDVKRQSGNEAVEFILADFSSPTEVRQLAAAFTRRFGRLDVLINNLNRGIPTAEPLSAYGLETHFALNYLASYLLTYRLLPLLKQTPGARIINTTSVAYELARPDLDDLQSEQVPHRLHAYLNSTLFSLYFSLDLARELQPTGITVNTVGQGWGGLTGWLVGPLRKRLDGLASWFRVGSNASAQTSVYLATSPDVAAVTGTYFVGQKPRKLLAIAENRANRARLKAQTERILNALD
ncbi:SDR family NAD(P)-dependent oxidoreductase [Rudanella paleaurantiibacter]|uniref:SDR family NAD(P)-dependent oxidoreductase n=1 Tax=Rudanella paleaurantiibacter TaxID=2614655 RepID=A0A7J5TX66_9BACT|nr:SDR family NAD(P)-dependent oxidoreductase [Rudanella paleaurantiibacter]KAB7729181.1 SDR family NAD(P)-dependent oxidoreductase [Rudanella paleaurantiibacter]